MRVFNEAPSDGGLTDRPAPHDLLNNRSRLSAFVPDLLFLKARMAYRRYSYASGRKVSPFDLYRTENVAFIHIPKNAGTFVNGAIYPQFTDTVATHINAHHSAQYLKLLSPQEFAAVNKFAILRHPADRFRSAFNYLKFDSPFETDKAFASQYLYRFSSFDQFCAGLTEGEVEDLLSWPHFQPQTCYICDRNGNLLVDALTTVEDLDSGLLKLGRIWGKQWRVEGKVGKSRSNSRQVESLPRSIYGEDLLLWSEVHSAPNRYLLVDSDGDDRSL